MQFLMQFLSEQNDFCEGYCVGAIVPLVVSRVSLIFVAGWELGSLGRLWEDLKTCDVNVPLHSRSHRNLRNARIALQLRVSVDCG